MKLVADANVLLSAVLGGQAKTVLQHPQIDEVLTAEATSAEIEAYVPILANRKRLSLDSLLLAIAALPVTVVEKSIYSSSLPRARKLIAGRNADEVDILALALHTNLPLGRTTTILRKQGSKGT